MWGHGFGFGWGGMIFGGLMMLLFWGGLIALAFVAYRATFGFVRSTGPQGAQSPPRREALEILKERYAGGEISKSDYDRMRADLM